MKYNFKEEVTEAGIAHVFSGPGVSGMPVVLVQEPTNEMKEKLAKRWEWPERQATFVQILLEHAYEAGRQSMKNDVKALLGIESKK